MTDEFLIGAAWLVFLSFWQNVSFTIVSRSRNRNNMSYHLVASVASNAVWFITFRELVKEDMTLSLLIPYTIGTVSGSLSGAKISMWIESWLGATADEHVKKDKQKMEKLENEVEQLKKAIDMAIVCYNSKRKEQ